MEFDVTVVDWSDIGVSICWLDGNDCFSDEQAARTQAVSAGNAAPFRVSISAHSSIADWQAREAKMSVSFTGSFDGQMSTVDDPRTLEAKPQSTLSKATVLNTFSVTVHWSRGLAQCL